VQATVRRFLTVGAAAGLVLLLAVVGDHLLPGGLPDGVIRTIGLLWLAGVGGLLIGTLVVNVFRRVNPVFLGREIEQAGGIRHNVLVNALLLQLRQREPAVVDASLTAAARALAADPPEHRYLPRDGAGRYVLVLATVVAWLL